MIFDEGIRKSLKQIDGYFHLELFKEGKTPRSWRPMPSRRPWRPTTRPWK